MQADAKHIFPLSCNEMVIKAFMKCSIAFADMTKSNTAYPSRHLRIGVFIVEAILPDNILLLACVQS